MGRAPIARSDGDQWLECFGASGQCSCNCKRIRPSPSGTKQGAFPAVLLKCLGMLGQGVEAVVVAADGVSAVSGYDLIGDNQRNSKGFVIVYHLLVGVRGRNLSF